MTNSPRADDVGTALHPAWPPRVSADDLAPDLPLSDEARANGYRRTPEGLVHGTARRARGDWRFDWDGMPDDAFEPNAKQVWAVLDRLSRLTFDEAQELVLHQPPTWVSGDDPWYDRVRAASRAAALAAGQNRKLDFESIARMARWIGDVVRPQHAAQVPGPCPGGVACTWNAAIVIAADAAQAFLVADRAELPRGARIDLTTTWLATFG